MIKKIIRNLIPPILYKMLSFFINYNKKNQLFDGEDDLFKNIISNDDIYGEYGCGQSTIWVSKNFDINIYSVETDYYWQKKTSEIIKSKKCKIHYENLGMVKQWGMPISYERCNLFHLYTDWIWKQKLKPTVILIDGRFRVCCFLTSLINGNTGSKIIFDDYILRHQYHYVEKYLKPIKKNKRQGLFIIPEKKDLDIERIKKSIKSFRYVFD